jgi:putative flippase GtrA
VLYAVLYLLCRVPFSAFTANLLALLLSTIANTAANRRLTFGVSGRDGAVGHQVRGLVVFLVGLGVTSGSLWLLHATGHDHHGTEVVVLTVANLFVTVLRFVAMRVWVFARRPHRVGSAHPHGEVADLARPRPVDAPAD